jgi:predicted RNA-binding Zn-ribbon protein involved in translation (DUF1610 family)
MNYLAVGNGEPCPFCGKMLDFRKRQGGHTERSNRKGSRFKCKQCGSETGHLINCPNGIASTPDRNMGGSAVNRNVKGEERGRMKFTKFEEKLDYMGYETGNFYVFNHKKEHIGDIY